MGYISFLKLLIISKVHSGNSLVSFRFLMNLHKFSGIFHFVYGVSNIVHKNISHLFVKNGDT